MTLVERLRTRFEETVNVPPLLSSDMGEPIVTPGTPAAVLAAIVDRPEPTFLLTRRPETMRKHPGQVAFPGGRADPEDAGPIATALREAEEEVALPPAAVTIIGTDGLYRSTTDYAIVPVIGVIPPDLPLYPHEAEVAEIFEVPLAFVFDPAKRIEHEVEFDGRPRRYYEIAYGRHSIWGATAAIIINLSRRLGGA